MQSYKICLIRHGITRANEEGLYVGKTDLPLSPSGLSRLIGRKKDSLYPPATRFFAPPLARCRQTLSVLYPGCTPEDTPGLSECDFGQWEGKSAAALQGDEPFQKWLTGESNDIPGGESAAAFQQRVTTAFQQLAQSLMQSGDTDAVVCAPGGVISLLMTAFALPRLSMKDWAAEDGQGFLVRLTPGIWMREPVMECVCMVP
jgi:alpha-ribazole phosphatase